MRTYILIALILVVAGCASKPEPYGKDSYIVSSTDCLGCMSPAQLQVNAAKRANDFCAKQGKVMVVRNASREGTQLLTGTSSGLIFSCVNEDDPEYTRPNLKRVPDTVIEDRRR